MSEVIIKFTYAILLFGLSLFLYFFYKNRVKSTLLTKPLVSLFKMVQYLVAHNSIPELSPQATFQLLAVSGKVSKCPILGLSTPRYAVNRLMPDLLDFHVKRCQTNAPGLESQCNLSQHRTF